MPRFSQRNGFAEIRSLAQIGELDVGTRIAIWNRILELGNIVDENRFSGGDWFSKVYFYIWTEIWEEPADLFGPEEAKGLVRKQILEEPFYDVFDSLESIVHTLSSQRHTADLTGKILDDAFNRVFEDYLVGYRFVEGQILEIDNTETVEAANQALSISGTVQSSKQHLKQALTHLTNRTSPDYRNSIKESILAVEAVAGKITGKAVLADALKALKSSGFENHPALLSAWTTMYGWTSDDGGLRHAGKEISDPSQSLAKYMFLTCSAFVAYLVEEGGRLGKL